MPSDVVQLNLSGEDVADKKKVMIHGRGLKSLFTKENPQTLKLFSPLHGCSPAVMLSHCS